MKKIISFMVAIIILVAMSACADQLRLSFLDNVSEVRYNLFANSDEEVYATFMSGLREEDYVLNGISTNKVEFGVVAFSMLHSENLYLTNAKYKLVINGKSYEGELARNPYDFTYVADIKKVVEGQPNITVKITSDELDWEMGLNNISDTWAVSHKDARDLGYKALKSAIKKHSKTKLLDGEVYIKILYDTTQPTVEYFWYVGVVFENNKNISVILDTQSGKVLSKKD